MVLSDVKNESVLRFIEGDYSDDERNGRTAYGIPHQLDVPVMNKIVAPNYGGAEKPNDSVKRVELEDEHFHRSRLKTEPVNAVYDRGRVKQKRCYNVIEVFHISEKDVDRGKEHSHAETENKEDENRDDAIDHPPRQMNRMVVRDIEKGDDKNQNRQRDQKRYER